MKLSESLFVPSLNMTWHWKGTEFNLLRDDEVIWTSLVKWTPSWDYPNANTVAKTLNNYINTPLDKLKAKEIDHIMTYRFHEQSMTDNFQKLIRLMLAADRRIGRSVQSLWLFVEPDREIRNIIGRRV